MTTQKTQSNVWNGRAAAISRATAWTEQGPVNALGKFLSSLCMPDQSVSLKDIAMRSITGQEAVRMREAIFEEEGVEYSGINIKTLDLVDFQRLRMENQAKILQMSEKAKEEHLANMAKKKEKQDKEREELKKELKKEMEETK